MTTTQLLYHKPPTTPAPIEVPADSTVEMTWQVFAGEAHELYLAALKERRERDGLGTSDEVLQRQFRMHLHRGISYPASPGEVKSYRSPATAAGAAWPTDTQ